MNYWQPAIVAFLSNYLPAYKAADIYVSIRHYICRERSTNQPILCKTNPILSAVGGLQMKVSIYYTKVYENETASGSRKNKPNSKPILSAVEWANFFKGQNELKIACLKIWPHPTGHAITKKLEISWIVITIVRILTIRFKIT